MNVVLQYRGAIQRLAILISVFSITACTGYGSTTIARDQLDYGDAIQQSIKQQLFSNIVRLRYLEAPLFVDVSSVINQYALIGRVNAGAGVNNSFLGENTGSLGAGGQWEDRPTITYSPISGKKFSESLLTPMQPEAIFALVQSGWPTDLMFRLTASSMNGIEDANGNHARQADPRYRELLDAWSRLRDSRTLGLRRAGDGGLGESLIVLYINESKMTSQTRGDLDFVRDVLDLNPDISEYVLRYGLVPDTKDEIAVMTESILDIMVDLAAEIDVPPEHVADGRTGPTFVDEGQGGPLFTVKYSETKPDDANSYVTIFNRGYWFYIDDRDVITKRTFAVLQVILSLTDSGDGARGPVVSIGQ